MRISRLLLELIICFKFVSDIKIAQNIAYKNSTCESVAQGVRQMLKKTEDYEIGEVFFFPATRSKRSPAPAAT